MRLLTAIPVYNEEAHLEPVLAEVLRHAPGEVLVVDDGSTDGTPERLARFPEVKVIRHERNRGYGAGLRSAFEATLAGGYDGLVTVVEVPVPLIYLDESRAFGGALDDAEYRLNHYRSVFQDALREARLEVAGECRG
jgi:glycosyltransferase involved in cell wall biosynthesis